MTQSDDEPARSPAEDPQRATQSGASPATEPVTLTEEAIKKCKAEQDDCLQIGKAFRIWAEDWSRSNAAWLIVVVVITVMTMVQMLLALGGAQTDLITGVLILMTAAVLAGYFAFNRPPPLDEIRDAANQFAGLSDQFEHAASMGPEKPEERKEELMGRFYKAFAQLLDQKSRIWRAAPLAPELCFDKARERPRNELVP